jgi:hypothetical protein
VLLGVVQDSAAGPKISKGTAKDGVIVYQDDSDPSQFYYVPARVDLDLGTTLPDFKVTYWGIGPSMLVQDTDGSISSRVGAVLSGRATIDISSQQRANISAQIAQDFGITNPKLLPLRLKEVTVQPLVAKNTLMLNNNQADLIFPTNLQFATTFNFLVGSGNSLFAQYVAAQSATSPSLNANPSFGINIAGNAEFVGDPWTATVTADLSSVWDEVRTHVSVSVSIGWFDIGSADYENIVQTLVKKQIIKMECKEGSLDTAQYGRQIFDSARQVFDQINKLAASGEGLFKFEPNPHVGTPGGGGHSWWPYSVSINGGYASASLHQSITYSNTISYAGRFYASVPASMTLGVGCNAATSSHFVDLRNTAVPCIDQAKGDRFQSRLAAELKAKNEHLKSILAKLENGQITAEQYRQIVAVYNTISFTEDGQSLSADSSVLPPGSMGLLGAEKLMHAGLTEEQINSLEKSVIQHGAIKGLEEFRKGFGK